MNNTSICTVTPVNRPKRKLIYLPSKSATDYFSYCEEVGCDWEGLLNSIPEKFDTASLIDLPDFLVDEDISKVAAGVEVPIDYDKPLPGGYKIAELEECTMRSTFKASHMKIPMILATVSDKYSKLLKTIILNVTAINLQAILRRCLISAQNLKSEQGLRFLF